jgi:ADP-ribose pyrophosphatase
VERIGSKTEYEGPIAGVRIDEFRYPDGSTSERQIVTHPGAVTMIPHDGESVWLVRQPREAVGEAALLELPAGKLDVEGESPLECAQRELVEEIGKSAGDWRELKSFYTSPGFATERVHLFLATELYDAPGDAEDDDRIEIVQVPLDQLDSAIDSCHDAKSLVGLLMLKRML